MDSSAPSNFAPDLPELLRQILWSRGIRDEQEIQNYLYPSLQNLVMPHGQMKDLDEAVRILLEAKDRKQNVLIFGDYDVDGATATALLYKSLQDLGWEVDWFIPHRVHEGYGITLKAVQKLKDQNRNFDVLISCDCGISSFEGIEALKNWGKKVIVTDHHECPPEPVPADAVINPKQSDCPYPEKRMAGVGIAFLLVLALRRSLDARDYSLKPQLELVAIGSVCDVAELQGNNRILVKAGLQCLSQSSFPGIRALLNVAGRSASELRSRDLGFLIGPRLNAAGRIGEASLGLQLLLSGEDEAFLRARELDDHNKRRRQLQDEQCSEALEFLETQEKLRSTCVVFSENFHLGIVGLVASKLSEKYKRPFCVLAKLDNEHDLANCSVRDAVWKGSLRAPKGYHLAKILQTISVAHSDLFLSFGGHAQAAGVALKEDRLEFFQNVFSEEVARQKLGEAWVERDLILEDPSGIEQLLDWMEPLGQGNEPPKFEVRNYRIDRVQVMKSEHIKIFGHWKGYNWPILQFKSPWVNIFSGLKGADLDFVGELSQNLWMGQKKLEFVLKEVLDWKQAGRMNGIEPKTNEVSNRPSF